MNIMINATRTIAALAFVAATLLAFPAMADESKGLKIGDQIVATDVSMLEVGGKRWMIKNEMKEKGTLVIFTCNHCPYVIAWQERTVKLANQAVEDGIGVIAINSNDWTDYPDDDIEGNRKRLQDLGMQYPYAQDDTSEVARAFGATKTPEFYLFDGEGKLVYHGALDDNGQDADGVTKTYLSDALAAVLAKKDVEVAETKALGCSIKFKKQ